MKPLNPAQRPYGGTGVYLHSDDFYPIPLGVSPVIIGTAANGNLYLSPAANGDKWVAKVTLPIGRMVLMLRGWQAPDRGKFTITLGGTTILSGTQTGGNINDRQWQSSAFTNTSDAEQELVITVSAEPLSTPANS